MKILTDRSAIQRRNRLLNENPLKVAYFFQKRAELFLFKCFNQKFKVKDYWWRIEFQHRGSPHVHGLFWFENAPSILNLTSQDTERLNQIKIYFDEILSTWHPNPCVIYDTHPSKLKYLYIDNHEFDYDSLIKAVQMHACSDFYCLRKKKFK